MLFRAEQRLFNPLFATNRNTLYILLSFWNCKDVQVLGTPWKLYKIIFHSFWDIELYINKEYIVKKHFLKIFWSSFRPPPLFSFICVLFSFLISLFIGCFAQFIILKITKRILWKKVKVWQPYWIKGFGLVRPVGKQRVKCMIFFN